MEVTSSEDSKETGVPFSSSPMSFALQPPKFNYDSAATKFYQNFVNPFQQFQTLGHDFNKPSRRDRDPDPVSVGSETPPPPPPPPPPPQPPASTLTTDPSPSSPAPVVRYRECLKNHAATLGGHVVDGCGEFMPSGVGSLKCVACECHRNFHRKEVDGESVDTKTDGKSDRITTPPPPPPLPQPVVGEAHRFSFQSPFTAPLMQMMMAFGESSSEDLRHVFEKPKHVPEQKSGGTRKRFRTKFSEEQKEKMTEFMEKLEWKISKEDEEKVLQLCSEIGVKRQVFQVWLHNSKQAMKKKHN